MLAQKCVVTLKNLRQLLYISVLYFYFLVYLNTMTSSPIQVHAVWPSFSTKLPKCGFLAERRLKYAQWSGTKSIRDRELVPCRARVAAGRHRAEVHYSALDVGQVGQLQSEHEHEHRTPLTTRVGRRYLTGRRVWRVMSMGGGAGRDGCWKHVGLPAIEYGIL